MAPSMFRNISPDPQAKDNELEIGPYWQIYEILMGCRYVLRRRSAAEVDERAILIDRKLEGFRTDVCEVAEELGADVPSLFNDADSLEFVTIPQRTFQLRRDEEDNASGVPWAAEMGWVEAEDLAVLGLMKVDQAIEATCDWTPENLMVTAGMLLEAYECLIHAERAGGRHILSADEFDRFKEEYAAAEKYKLSMKRSKAVNNRSTERLRLHTLELYRKLKVECCEKPKRELLDDILERWNNKSDGFCEYNRVIYDDNARRTMREWINGYEREKESTIGNTKNAAINIASPPTQIDPNTLKTIRDKHRF